MNIKSALFVVLCFPLSSQAPTASDPARQWVSQAAAALGGEQALRQISAVEMNGIAVQYQREQSERPEGPWFATYSDFTDVRNFTARAVRRTARTRGYSTPDWVNNRDWQPETTTLVIDGVGLRNSEGHWTSTRAPWDIASLPIEFEPERLVITALDAPDLRAEPDIHLHGYPHHVVAFTSGDSRVRVILSVPSMLPKAVEVRRARPFDVFWAPWGDVTERVTFGNWVLEPQGIHLPRMWEFSTDGQIDGRVDITRVRLSPAVAAEDFAIPDDTRLALITNRRPIADRPFGSTRRPEVELAPGIVKVPGDWDIVEVRQSDGVVILEGPLTSSYSAKVIEDAARRFAGSAIKAVVTTSDAWPHLGGMREYVARGVPVYALDLNVPLLKRLLAAKYETFPDALARVPKPATIRAVAAGTIVGTGANRIELIPLRTASGERQMMVYFPAHALLYTSDLFTLSPDGAVFLPQEVSEAVDAATREHLRVERAFGMHYDVVPWRHVVDAAVTKPY
jgi:hypothetical protein